VTVIGRELPCEGGHESAMENGYHYCARCGHSLTPDGRNALVVAAEELQGAVETLKEVRGVGERTTSADAMIAAIDVYLKRGQS
jgi:hypothetical protein